MKKIALLLGLHSHQPVDNFHEVVDDAIEKSYYPFLKIALKYSDFKFSLHYSGWLLEYIKKNSPKTFTLMQELSQKNQIEFLTGGFYEPILASIPSCDRISQILKLNEFIKDNFDQTPKGLWLTERVWDNTIIKDITSLGIEYVVVDDYHFINAGFDKDRLNGYFLTEDEGRVLKIFPINKELRYTIPFAKVDRVKSYLESIADESLSAGVIFDDGEKFGIWPKTYEWVYQKGWLEEFIRVILDSKVIKPMLYREYLDSTKPISLAYLPTTSYIEMGSWALKSKDANTFYEIQEEFEERFGKDESEKFLKGSIWKNFLIKYYEANHIQKRALELSLNRVEDDNYLKSLYKAQTNDVLWHGVFGGIYLPNLRDNAYRFIIDCENIRYLDIDKSVTEVKDINLDGFDEIKCVSKNLIAIFDPKVGAQLVEFDIRDKSFNFQNTMSRYYEAYHQKIIDPKDKRGKDVADDEILSIHDNDEADLSKYKDYLKYDWYVKNSFIDHVVDFEFDLEKFKSCSFSEYGDFANCAFETLESKNESIYFKREGGIYIDGKKSYAVLEKIFFVDDEEISFWIYFNHKSNKSLKYLQEFNLHFANIKDITLNLESFREDFIIKESERLSIYDSYTNKTIDFKLSKKADIYISRVDTLSQSELGFDLTNQAISIGFLFDLTNSFELYGKLKVN